MAIPFAEGATTMSVRVWTPEANPSVQLKVEKDGDPTVSVEAQTTSALAPPMGSPPRRSTAYA